VSVCLFSWLVKDKLEHPTFDDEQRGRDDVGDRVGGDTLVAALVVVG